MACLVLLHFDHERPFMHPLGLALPLHSLTYATVDHPLCNNKPTNWLLNNAAVKSVIFHRNPTSGEPINLKSLSDKRHIWINASNQHIRYSESLNYYHNSVINTWCFINLDYVCSYLPVSSKPFTNNLRLIFLPKMLSGVTTEQRT